MPACLFTHHSFLITITHSLSLSLFVSLSLSLFVSTGTCLPLGFTQVSVSQLLMTQCMHRGSSCLIWIRAFALSKKFHCHPTSHTRYHTRNVGVWLVLVCLLLFAGVAAGLIVVGSWSFCDGHVLCPFVCFYLRFLSAKKSAHASYLPFRAPLLLSSVLSLLYWS